MAASLLSGRALSTDAHPPITDLHLPIVVGLALAAVVWGATFIIGTETHEVEMYLALLAFYGVCSAAFVMSRIRGSKLQLFELPVFMTAMFLLQFGVFPLRNFIDPEQIDTNLSANGEELVRALSYVTLGMVAFWVGCGLARRKRGEPVSPHLGKQGSLPDSRGAGVLLFTVALYTATFVTKLYLLNNQLYSYLASMDKYYANLASMQVLNYISQLGTVALVIVAIERYRERYDPLWRITFIAVLSSELLWGLVSGMKGLLLQNFIIVALVSSFVRGRLNLRWLVIPFFALVLFYPLSDAYRSIVRGRDPEEVTSFKAAARAARTAFMEVAPAGANAGYSWREGLSRTLRRMDLLTSVAQVLALGPRADLLKGNERWWMLPIYPFIPRFLWRSKPILNEGGRFTVALRGGSEDVLSAGSGTAVTYPGDLYLRFGLPGILVGMFVLGVVAQWFTNPVAGPFEPQNLFLYAGIYVFGFSFEMDAFDFWATLLKILAILCVLRWIIYGRRTHWGHHIQRWPVNHEDPDFSRRHLHTARNRPVRMHS
jgi:hypothetical protein